MTQRGRKVVKLVGGGQKAAWRALLGGLGARPPPPPPPPEIFAKLAFWDDFETNSLQLTTFDKFKFIPCKQDFVQNCERFHNFQSTFVGGGGGSLAAPVPKDFFLCSFMLPIIKKALC